MGRIYFMSRKQLPNLYSNLLYKMGHYFLGQTVQAEGRAPATLPPDLKCQNINVKYDQRKLLKTAHQNIQELVANHIKERCNLNSQGGGPGDSLKNEDFLFLPRFLMLRVSFFLSLYLGNEVSGGGAVLHPRHYNCTTIVQFRFSPFLITLLQQTGRIYCIPAFYSICFLFLLLQVPWLIQYC